MQDAAAGLPGVECLARIDVSGISQLGLALEATSREK